MYRGSLHEKKAKKVTNGGVYMHPVIAKTLK